MNKNQIIDHLIKIYNGEWNAPKKIIYGQVGGLHWADNMQLTKIYTAYFLQNWKQPYAANLDWQGTADRVSFDSGVKFEKVFPALYLLKVSADPSEGNYIYIKNKYGSIPEQAWKNPAAFFAVQKTNAIFQKPDTGFFSDFFQSPVKIGLGLLALSFILKKGK